MRNKTLKFIKYSFGVCLIVFLYKILWPVQYDVPPFQKRKDTLYWNLPTGSQIGYTFLPAKGNKKPCPLIYLHGGPGGPLSVRSSDMLTPLTEDGFDVYLYDQIGGGQSARLSNIEEYTAERHEKDLDEIIKKIGAEKVILIGQSWGAILAVLFAADHPEKVEKIIFTSPGPIYPIHRELAQTKSPDSLHLRQPSFSNAQANEKTSSLRMKSISMCATHFGFKLASDKEADAFYTYLSNETNKSMVCDTAKIRKAEAGGGYYASIMTVQCLMDVPDPRPKLQNSQIPILVMKGQCDNQKWGFTREYLDVFSNHQLVVIPDAGHGIYNEQPEAYLKTIRLFLNK